MSDEPQFLNDFKGGEQVQGKDRAERLKNAGIPEPESREAYEQRRRDEAWQQAGGQEDSGAEFARLNAKMGRGNVEMPQGDIHEQVRKLAEKGGRPLHPETGLPVEPETKESIVGYSEEKKAALAKAKKSSKKAKE